MATVRGPRLLLKTPQHCIRGLVIAHSSLPQICAIKRLYLYLRSGSKMRIRISRYGQVLPNMVTQPSVSGPMLHTQLRRPRTMEHGSRSRCSPKCFIERAEILSWSPENIRITLVQPLSSVKHGISPFQSRMRYKPGGLYQVAVIKVFI